jgi:predicted ester cyclase
MAGMKPPTLVALSGFTHTGPIGNLPPTNKKIHISGIAISKIVDRKIAEDVAYFGTLKMMQQLGFKLIPPQGPAE